MRIEWLGETLWAKGKRIEQDGYDGIIEENWPYNKRPHYIECNLVIVRSIFLKKNTYDWHPVCRPCGDHINGSVQDYGNPVR